MAPWPAYRTVRIDVSTTTPTHRRGSRGARAAALALLLLAAVAGAAALVLRAAPSEEPAAGRSELDRILDRLVSGPDRVSPGGTAYVTGPKGAWAGSAGLADVKTGQPMQPELAMHLDSNSKAWMATVVLQLVGEGRIRLEDTVERWLPGLLPFGERITIRQLLSHTSGLVDDRNVDTDPVRFIRRLRDPALRAEAFRLWRRQQTDPTVQISPLRRVKLAAALGLQWRPGMTYSYSNIGYEVAGLVAAKVGGTSLAELYRERIIEPLGLATAAYGLEEEVAPPRPFTYGIHADGRLVEATDWYRAGVGASGGMLASAADETRFLASLMRGELLGPDELEAMKTPSAASESIGASYGLGLAVTALDCDGVVYGHGGSGYSTASSAVVSEDGRRVAVVLLNGHTLGSNGLPDARTDNAVVAAANELFCAG